MSENEKVTDGGVSVVSSLSIAMQINRQDRVLYKFVVNKSPPFVRSRSNASDE